MVELNNPTMAPSFLFITKPAKKIIRVKISMLGIYANIYPKTTAKAENVPINAIRKLFFSNQTD